MTSPFSFSQASVTYKKGDAEIEQKIMDSGFNQLLFTPFTMFMAAGYEKETQDGFERSVNVAGNPGWEKWDKGSRNGELNVVVEQALPGAGRGARHRRHQDAAHRARPDRPEEARLAQVGRCCAARRGHGAERLPDRSPSNGRLEPIRVSTTDFNGRTLGREAC